MQESDGFLYFLYITLAIFAEICYNQRVCNFCKGKWYFMIFPSKTPAAGKKPKKTSFTDDLLDWLSTICKTFVLVILVFTFVARTARVEGRSMQPTLVQNDFLVLWSLGYKPAQGDIIACNCNGLGKVIVKRVIAVGGQTVDIDFANGDVYVDGEIYKVDGIQNITTDRESNFVYPMTVPEGKYFVMGDNRQQSTDSRSSYVGFVDREDILGKAVLRILPLQKFGTLYGKKDA